MSNNDQPSDNTSFGERMGVAMIAFMRALLRLLIIAILAVIVGAGLYYGVPAIYDRYVQPIRMDINGLQGTLADQEQVIQQLSGRVEDLSERINTLTIQADNDKQTIAELQTQLDSALSAQANDLIPIQDAQTTATTRLDDIDRALKEVDDQITAMSSDLQILETGMAQNQDQLVGLSDQLEIEGTPLELIRNELQIVKAMELLTRSRLLLDTNNLGLAQKDLIAASELLNDLRATLPGDQQENLAEIIDRLDKASNNLPSRPILASDDLEIAWQLLLTGLPGQAPVSTLETLDTSAEATGTATPEATATPTPTP